MITSFDSITPDTVLSSGGTEIFAVGSGFSGVTDVTIDGINVSFVIVDDDHITVTTAPHVAGLVELDLIDPDGAAGAGIAFVDSLPTSGDCITLTAGSFLADGATPDGDGIIYTPQAVDGWFDSPPVRVGTLEAQPRGETIAAQHELGRVIDLQIVAHVLGGLPLTNAFCFTAMESIKTAFRVVFVPVLLDIIDPSGQERQALVRRNGPIKQQILGDGVAVRFSIPLLAEDPRLVTV